MVERFIDGLELTVTILNGRALPIICMTPATEFYDYEAKYLSDATDYQCPAKLDAALTKHLTGVLAFQVEETVIASNPCHAAYQ